MIKLLADGILRPKVKRGVKRKHKVIMGVVILFYALNPVAMLKHGAIGAKVVNYQWRQIKYAYVDFTRGDTIGEMLRTKDSLASNGRAFAKVFKDVRGLF